MTADPLYVAYHDEEWGKPLRDPDRLFEMLVLEGAQAGLSWLTILKKREAYRRAFHGFDAARVARYGAKDRARLLADAGIVRNRLKIESAITNARAYLAMRDEFAETLWGFVPDAPRVTRWKRPGLVPSRTKESDAMSKELKRRGFKFVGSTICYAFMQAVGIVDDHLARCAFGARR